MLRRQKVLGHDKQMEALEVRNKQLVEYIEDLERDLAGRLAEQVLTASHFPVFRALLTWVLKEIRISDSKLSRQFVI